MRDVERLKYLRNKIKNHLGFFSEETMLLDRIINRLGPYEPEEIIQVGSDEVGVHGELPFLCKQGGGVWVRDNVYGQACATWWPHHRPIPKTKTLDVPVEILEKAKTVRGYSDGPKDCIPANIIQVCKWLAEQAEANDENTD